MREALYGLRERPLPLFVFPHTSLPAASLWIDARRWTAKLREHGLGARSRVVLQVRETPSVLAVVVAGLWTGTTLIPIRGDRLAVEQALARSRANALIATDGPEPELLVREQVADGDPAEAFVFEGPPYAQKTVITWTDVAERACESLSGREFLLGSWERRESVLAELVPALFSSSELIVWTDDMKPPPFIPESVILTLEGEITLERKWRALRALLLKGGVGHDAIYRDRFGTLLCASWTSHLSRTSRRLEKMLSVGALAES